MDPELYGKTFELLRKRLERGNMVPFYKISKRMRAWMSNHKIRQTTCADWHAKYYDKVRPMPEGYTGIVYEAERKTVIAKGLRYVRYLSPERFYLELPTELVSKALVLGMFP